MFTFDLFRLKNRYDGVAENSGDAGVNEGLLLYKAGLLCRDPAKSDHPPHLGSAKCLLPS